MEHSDIKVGETIWIKAKKISEGGTKSQFATGTIEEDLGFWMTDNDLVGAITDTELQELRKKATENFMPEVGKEYEFLHVDGDWIKGNLAGFMLGSYQVPYSKIRPIQTKTITMEIPQDMEEAVRNLLDNRK